MMKSLDLTVGDALYLYAICLILPDSSDFLLYKESLFLWLCIEPPGHAWRCPAIQQYEEAQKCEEQEERSSNDKYNDSQVSDISEDPRPAKRRRASPSYSDSTSKRSRKLRS